MGPETCRLKKLLPAIDIPEGTQTRKQFRLRGKGIKGVRASYRGDLYCHKEFLQLNRVSGGRTSSRQLRQPWGRRPYSNTT